MRSRPLPWKRLAAALLWTAVVLFILGQVLPYDRWENAEEVIHDFGWELWYSAIEVVMDGSYLDLPMALAIAAMYLGAPLTLAGPWLPRILGGSRILWWVAVSAAVMVCAFFPGYLLTQVVAGDGPKAQPGVFPLAGSPFFLLAGLLCIRWRSADEGTPPETHP